LHETVTKVKENRLKRTYLHSHLEIVTSTEVGLSKSKVRVEEDRGTNTKIGSEVSTIGYDQENIVKHKPKTKYNIKYIKKNTETQQNNQQTATAVKAWEDTHSLTGA
jgi:hypothetical protein